jgi:hypothetical protein
MNSTELINSEHGKEKRIMRNLLASAVAVLFSALLIITVNAGPIVPAAPQSGEGQVQKIGKGRITPQVAEKKPGYSVAKDYKKRVANKKRAAEMRKKMIQQGK